MTDKDANIIAGMELRIAELREAGSIEMAECYQCAINLLRAKNEAPDRAKTVPMSEFTAA